MRKQQLRCGPQHDMCECLFAQPIRSSNKLSCCASSLDNFKRSDAGCSSAANPRDSVNAFHRFRSGNREILSNRFEILGLGGPGLHALCSSCSRRSLHLQNKFHQQGRLSIEPRVLKQRPFKQCVVKHRVVKRCVAKQ